MTNAFLLVPFLLIAGGLLTADLLFHRRYIEPISLANASFWSAAYIGGAMLYAYVVYSMAGPGPASLFLAGFAMEKALSVDNLMVFIAIFSYFKIPAEHQYRVLRWGFAGAIFFRLVFVAIGAGGLALLGPWVGIVFGLLVLWSAAKMIQSDGSTEHVEYSKEWYVRWAKRWIGFTDFTLGNQFFLRGTQPGILYGTPMLLALIAVEISDVLFSFDSVPAVIAVTRDPVLIYTAMIFAIMGLRTLYFVLTALLKFLRFLPYAVIAILMFIGVKMLVASAAELMPGMGLRDLSPVNSLYVVLGALAIGIITSIIWPEPDGTVS